MDVILEQAIKAIKEDDPEALERLLNNEPSLIMAKTHDGMSLPMLAAYYKNPETLKVLLTKKTCLDIWEACATGNMEELRRSFAENCELINETTCDGFYPIGLAAYFGQFKCVEFLIEKGAPLNRASNNAFNVTPLHSATAIQHLELVSLLIRKGANVNARQVNGITPLHTAAHYGNQELVNILIKAGADPKCKTNDGKTPLNMAFENGHFDLNGI